MKMGNTSMSIIPVPDFFLNKTLYDMETFKVIKKKSYFKEKDLFYKTKDLNLANNPRINLNKFESFNKTKYFPPHRSLSQNEPPIKSVLQRTTFTNKEFFNQKLPPECLNYKKYQDYMHKINEQYNTTNFRDTLRSNLNDIVESVHLDYDVKKWSTSKETLPEYMYEINSIVTGNNAEYDNSSKNFQTTLRNKINSLQLDTNKKEKVITTFINNTDHNMKTSKISKKRDKPDNLSDSSAMNTIESNKSPLLTNINNTCDGGFPFKKLSANRIEFHKQRGERMSYRRREASEPEKLIQKHSFPKIDAILPNLYNANEDRRGPFDYKSHGEYGLVFENDNNPIKNYLK